MESEAESQINIPVTAFQAIQKQVKGLCLKDFPCGLGSWREDEASKKVFSKKDTHKSLKTKDKINGIEITENQFIKESVEALEELITSSTSPWHLECTWSEEAEKLRTLGVEKPWLLTWETILSQLKTVRIHDKGIVLVDKKLLKLRNLEELSMSANDISEISSENLPMSLKRLELYANKITDIARLCVKPPLLDHLGLGCNLLTSIDQYFTQSHWPNLLSLDLSHNDLTDLVKVISALTTLPKLRHLVLCGNPLSLTPGYHGYTIDSLKKLMALDDMQITVDEKLSFQKFSKIPDCITSEAKIQIELPYIKGIPCPDEIKLKEASEFPVVERQYFVQFMFVDSVIQSEEQITPSKTDHKNTIQIFDENIADEQPMEVATLTNSEDVLQENIDNEKGEHHVDNKTDDQPEAKKNVMSPEEVIPSNQNLETCLESEPRLIPIKTAMFPWAPEQMLNSKIDLARNDLLSLRNFFRQGMDIAVIEQLVLGYPSEAKEKDAKGKAAKLAKKEKLPEKPKSAQRKEVKKKKDDIDLVKSEPVEATIASFHIPLKNLLDGDCICKMTFTTQDLPPPLSAFPDDGDKSHVKAKEKRKDSTMSLDKNKNAKKDEKKKGKSTENIVEQQGPEQLQLEVIVTLKHWSSTKEALKEKSNV